MESTAHSPYTNFRKTQEGKILRQAPLPWLRQGRGEFATYLFGKVYGDFKIGLPTGMMALFFRRRGSMGSGIAALGNRNIHSRIFSLFLLLLQKDKQGLGKGVQGKALLD
ncbi:hypothetical protein DSY3292 [Desulfitobacterium hafniense Y51]|uniref:Uncharacterized protein n=1 Tax=Desulfitobacterium hafniense (strain Y51) TaxID=138119 RepID=Q24SB1_DESHY|nr:hypothetical protein DSY3292 [Desulfitobacterium hafniense Y51]